MAKGRHLPHHLLTTRRQAALKRLRAQSTYNTRVAVTVSRERIAQEIATLEKRLAGRQNAYNTVAIPDPNLAPA